MTSPADLIPLLAAVIPASLPGCFQGFSYVPLQSPHALPRLTYSFYLPLCPQLHSFRVWAGCGKSRHLVSLWYWHHSHQYRYIRERRQQSPAHYRKHWQCCGRLGCFRVLPDTCIEGSAAAFATSATVTGPSCCCSTPITAACSAQLLRKYKKPLGKTEGVISGSPGLHPHSLVGTESCGTLMTNGHHSYNCQSQ